MHTSHYCFPTTHNVNIELDYLIWFNLLLIWFKRSFVWTLTQWCKLLQNWVWEPELNQNAFYRHLHEIGIIGSTYWTIPATQELASVKPLCKLHLGRMPEQESSPTSRLWMTYMHLSVNGTTASSPVSSRCVYTTLSLSPFTFNSSLGLPHPTTTPV